jgi:uncharacterized membrane protein
MPDPLITAVLQTPNSWHEGGMFIGMHWAWWSFWILTSLVLAWAFWRVFADRTAAHRQVQREEAAEEELRRRFARGEIDEDGFANRLRVLRETHTTV